MPADLVLLALETHAARLDSSLAMLVECLSYDMEQKEVENLSFNLLHSRSIAM